MHIRRYVLYVLPDIITSTRFTSIIMYESTFVRQYFRTFVLSYEIKQRSTTLASYVVHTVRLLPELAFFE